MTLELKELNEVEDIKSKLAEMYGSVKDEASSTLGQIQDKFRNHETEFKQKLCKYVGNIRENLKTLAQEPHAKIGELRTKIEELAGIQLDKRGGRLGMLMDVMGDLQRKYGRFAFHQYMEYPSSFNQDTGREYIQIGEPVMWFINGAVEYINKMEPTMWKLQQIPAQLNLNSELKTIIGEIEKVTPSNIDDYEKDISRHESKIHKLNILFQYTGPYKNTLSKTKKALEEIRRIKQSINDNKKKFKPKFLKEVTSITDITEEDLDDITKRLKEIIEIVDLIQKYIDNTRLFFRYLNVFKEHKRKIDKLNIEGNNISEIHKTIKSIEWSTTYISIASIYRYREKNKLENSFNQTWKTDTDRETALRAIKTDYFPGDLKVIKDLEPFDRHVEKLRAIEDFNTIMKPIAIASDLGRMETMEPRTTIKELSSHILRLYGIISSVKQTIESQVGFIESSYELNESNLNGMPNGNNIQGNVGKIYNIYYIIYTIFIDSSDSSKGSRPRSLR